MSVYNMRAMQTSGTFAGTPYVALQTKKSMRAGGGLRESKIEEMSIYPSIYPWFNLNRTRGHELAFAIVPPGT